MNSKVRLSQAAIIVTLAIMLSLIAAYVPMLSILGLVVSVPYAMIGTLTDSKHSILSVIVTFILLMLLVDPIYAVNISILSAIPGIVIGTIARRNLIEGEQNKFEPIYGGTIIFVVCTIIFFFVAQIFFKIDLMKELMAMMTEAMKAQLEVMKSVNPSMTKGIKVEDMVNGFRNLIPVALFFQGLILSFITYYFEVFVLRRINRAKLELPKVRDFYLPGNAVMISLMLYLLVLFIEFIGLNLYTKLIMVNLQLVFNCMFMIQGIAVCIYYIGKLRKQGPSKGTLFGGLMICITGFTGISFIGMLDSVIDFRKVRSYKST